MKSFLSFCVLLGLVSATIDGPGTLYPGYVVNYNTPKNTEDVRYAYLPVEGINSTAMPVNLTISYEITDAPIGSSASAQIRRQPNSRPDQSSQLILTNSNRTFVEVNTTNANYFLSVLANCNQATCDSKVQVAISAYTPSLSKRNWPPYMLISQRRTAKFKVAVNEYLYFWLVVTDAQLNKDLKMKLYIGVNFYEDEEDSGIQALVFDDQPNWPTATVNVTDGAKFFYPTISPIRKDDWIMDGSSDAPTPFILDPGLYQVCFYNPVAGHTAQFTTKVGFNEPPKQAANPHASFHRLGLVGLISICILANMKHFLF